VTAVQILQCHSPASITPICATHFVFASNKTG